MPSFLVDKHLNWKDHITMISDVLYQHVLCAESTTYVYDKFWLGHSYNILNFVLSKLVDFTRANELCLNVEKIFAVLFSTFRESSSL